MATHLSIELDETIRPQDDFFSYVNSKWLKDNPIPESESRWGTFNVLRENAWMAMRDIYKNVQDTAPKPHSIEQQARDFYYTGMHFDTFKEAHIAWLDGFFARIDEIKDTEDLSATIGKLHALDITGPWSCFVDSDHDDSSQHILHFRQSGLTLPSRDYYIDKGKKMHAIRKAYKQHLEAVHAHLPSLAPSASTLANVVMTFETELATISRTPAALRDIEKNFNKTPLEKVKTTYPSISWELYAKAFGWEADDKITIDQPEFIKFINDAFSSYPLETWKIYLKWRLAVRLLGKTSKELAELHFDFFGRVLSGTKENMPLWKRVVLTAEFTIGEATAQLYTKKHFPESSKKQVLALVEEIRTAYSERIDTLEWMSGKTKVYAKKKLANMKVLIGYPDTWRDFSALEIGRVSYIENIVAAQKFDVAYWLSKLHQPTSRDDWLMTPQTVNAYNDPTRLVICFPAAILQSPFFDPAASHAVNLGGIGTVIGHEFTHGFDDQGCMFDAKGNVRKWQTNEERGAFKKRTEIVVKHADTFEVLPDLTLRGQLVLGESIADLGGLELSLHALKKHQPTDIDFKQFFINYAFTECAQLRDEKLREYTLNDPHPDCRFRVNGMLQHVDDFYKTFGVAKNDTLYRAVTKRAQIW